MQSRAALGMLATILVASACSDSNGSGDNATLAFNAATRPAPAAAGLALSGEPLTLTDGVNTLIIETAQLVIRDLKFHLVEDGTCVENGDGDTDDDNSGTGGTADNASTDGDEADDEDCDELKIGPYLLDLPLGAGAARQFTIDLPAGTYREVKFKVHKPNRSSDAAFVAAHPEFDQRSVRVLGTYNGARYEFTSDVEASQEAEFNPPLTLATAGGAELTLFVDISTWFLVDGSLVDPAIADTEEPLSSRVKNNIKASIRAFEDDDRDGHDDDDDDDDSSGSSSDHD